jgi:hypothetical protein
MQMRFQERKSYAMRRWVPACFALVLGFFVAVPAQGQRSEMTLGIYKVFREGARQNDPTKTLALAYLLDGLIDGMKVLNAAYIDAGAKPQFCVPRDFEISAVYLRDAIDELLARNPTWREEIGTGVGFFAKEALEQRFPCED